VAKLAAGALVLGLMAAAAGCQGGGEEGLVTSRQPGRPVTIIGVDVDPTGNGPSTLGTIDKCRQVSVGDSIMLDVFIDDVPSGVGVSNFGAFGGLLNFDNSKLNATAFSHAAGVSLIMVDPQSSLLDLTSINNPAGYINITVVDSYLPAGDAAEPAGSRGVMGRYTFSVVGGSGTLTALTLSGAPGFEIVDSAANAINDYPFSNSPGDDDGDTLADEDPVWDGNFNPQYGLIAIDQPCPD
jgi:hypothetical protein